MAGAEAERHEALWAGRVCNHGWAHCRERLAFTIEGRSSEAGPPITDEPKRGVRRVDNLEQKRAEWRQEVEEAKQWLRDRDIDPQRAYQTWWSQSGSKLKTERKFDNRRNVVRQLGVRIWG